jgi:hypothetical protein
MRQLAIQQKVRLTVTAVVNVRANGILMKVRIFGMISWVSPSINFLHFSFLPVIRVAFQGCTNSGPGTYPPEWDDSQLTSRYMFDSFAACCKSPFFSADKECVKTDLCPDDPASKDCSALKW